uniref:Uncharacterized protein n=1 Tax=Romanomermis culicivorax TaxID=13658 RepID=A0A915IFW6_ROMCU
MQIHELDDQGRKHLHRDGAPQREENDSKHCAGIQSSICDLEFITRNVSNTGVQAVVPWNSRPGNNKHFIGVLWNKLIELENGTSCSIFGHNHERWKWTTWLTNH